MNPEIRFRVPKHVHQLANERAEALGLEARRGRTGGASEIARGALYTFLGLGVPEEWTDLVPAEIARIKATRRHFQEEEHLMTVTVHHRVSDRFRKQRALELGEQVASRATTRFRFQPGELPHFLIPYIALTEEGAPFGELNLEGTMSPRKNSLGKLVSASNVATLDELEACLAALLRKGEERRKAEAEREARAIKGAAVLREWAQSHGSELLRERLRGGFEWMELVEREYSLAALRTLGLSDLVYVPLTQSLGAGAAPFRNPRNQPKPQLATMKRLRELALLEDPGLHFKAILVEDTEGRTLEAIRISFQLPTPSRTHFLTSLIPAE